MKAWLKVLGSASAPIPERGLCAISWITDDIGFPAKPSVRIGDRLVLYAAGHGRIFGVVEVNLQPYVDRRSEPWSHRCPVRPRLVLDELCHAPTLEAASAGTRDLRRSIRQQSHIALTEAEYDAAVSALLPVARPADISRPDIGGRI